jgi:hypothetical protein
MAHQLFAKLALGLAPQVPVHAFGFSRLLPQSVGAFTYRLFIQLGHLNLREHGPALGGVETAARPCRPA